MGTQGICFFSDYRLPVPLLAIALYSLRKHYSGNVHVVYGADTPDFFVHELKKSGVCSFQKTDLKFRASVGLARIQRCFNVKPKIHLLCPYDVNMMYDCDHLFTNPFDESAFDIIKKHGLISFHDLNQGVTSRHRAKRRTQILNNLGMKTSFLRVVNGGCVGSTKDSPLITEWIDTLNKMLELKHHIFTRLPDEYSLSYVMGQHNVPLGDFKWSYCVKPGEESRVQDKAEKLIGIHFPHGRYFKVPFYIEKAKEAKAANFLSLSSRYQDYALCNTIMQSL